jgi:predicted nucleic acid-binding protein
MFYVDSCVYLNLWQKEVSKAGRPLWKFALDFFDYAEKENKVIYVSGFVLKELGFVLDEAEFEAKRQIFNDETRFRRIIATPEDYDNARRLESETGFEISFFDCMHIVLAKKTGVTLITRDGDLIKAASPHCVVSRPEDIVRTC